MSNPFSFYWEARSSLNAQASSVFNELKSKAEEIFGEVVYTKEDGYDDNNNYSYLELNSVGDIYLTDVQHENIDSITEDVDKLVAYIKNNPEVTFREFDGSELDIDTNHEEFTFHVAKRCILKGVSPEDAVNLIFTLACDVPEDIVDV